MNRRAAVGKLLLLSPSLLLAQEVMPMTTTSDLAALTVRVGTLETNLTALTGRVATLEGAAAPAPAPAPATALTLLHADPMTGDQSVEWGSLQAVAASRITLLTSAGDPRPRGDGSPSPLNCRRLSLLDGDNFYGERCEIGANERRYGIAGGAGTFMLFQPGQRYHTWFSLRLPSGYPNLTGTAWSVIMQMKQCQPYTNDGSSSPILSMQANQGTFQVLGKDAATTLYKVPVQTDRWVRFHFDITYSPDPAIGRVRVQIDDRAGASDFVAQHDSGDIKTQTLTKAVGAQSGSGWSLADGEPIPSHLRLGPYRNATIAGSTYLDVSNVQVFQPA